MIRWQTGRFWRLFFFIFWLSTLSGKPWGGRFYIFFYELLFRFVYTVGLRRGRFLFCSRLGEVHCWWWWPVGDKVSQSGFETRRPTKNNNSKRSRLCGIIGKWVVCKDLPSSRVVHKYVLSLTSDDGMCGVGATNNILTCGVIYEYSNMCWNITVIFQLLYHCW